ncbi:unnamed protein product [Effrenium voratum]|nr:unnamed protein product [Effrenium voratum]
MGFIYSGTASFKILVWHVWRFWHLGEVRVLEIGCGSGRWARSLFPDDGKEGTVVKYLGLDSSSTMVVESAQTLSKILAASIVRADARRAGALKEACDSFLGVPDRSLARRAVWSEGQTSQECALQTESCPRGI